MFTWFTWSSSVNDALHVYSSGVGVGYEQVRENGPQMAVGGRDCEVWPVSDGVWGDLGESVSVLGALSSPVRSCSKAYSSEGFWEVKLVG